MSVARDIVWDRKDILAYLERTAPKAKENMTMATRRAPVEVYAGWNDHTWTTHMVEVDADTEEDAITEAAEDAFYAQVLTQATKRKTLAFVGVFGYELTDFSWALLTEEELDT